MPGDKWDQYQEQSQDKWGQYADQSQPAYDPYKEIPDARDPNVFAKAASDTIQGIGEGALNTIHGTGELLRRGGNAIHAGLGDKIIPPVGQSALGKIATPDNTMQAIGKGAEQVGEFLIPGIGEEAGIAKGTRAAPLIKAGINALDTGIRNKLQGGDFGTGVLGGAGGEALGAGLKKAAPAMAETALGITNKMRGNGRTIGQAILDETSGIRPATLAAQSGKRIGDLTNQMERGVNMATNSWKTATTHGANQVLDNAIANAPRNAKDYVGKLNSLRDLLDFKQGPGPQQRVFTPDDILEMKRGIDKEISSWSPEQRKGVEGVKKQLYRALDSELDRVSPGNDELNQRISSLIPAKQRAEQIGRNAGVTQRIAHRISAPTGALAGALGGGILGYEQGGPKRALAYGLGGLVIPEAISSPAGRMAMARTANSGILPRIMAGSGLQLNRPRKTDNDRE